MQEHVSFKKSVFFLTLDVIRFINIRYLNNVHKIRREALINMKILQLGKFYPPLGGVEKLMVLLVNGLSEKGITCDMLCTNAKVGLDKKVININNCAKIYCTKALMKKFATMISPTMISELRHICNNYDLIHVHHPDPMAALALFLSGYKGKVVLHWHSDIMKQKHLLKMYRPLQNWLTHRADLIVGTSPVYIKESPDLHNVLSKCTYLPIGVSPMKGDAKKVLAIRDRFKGKKIIFSLGRLVHYKGFRYLIEAAQYLPDDYVVIIGGSGALRDSLLEEIQELGLSGKVILLGRVPDGDLPSYFEACDLFCLSSIQKTEAFAIVQVEAFSCGKPVVATNIPGSGVSWVNANGVSGLNVPIEDGKALADAITKILSSPVLYKKFSEGARKRYEDVFTEQMMVDKCLEIYKQVLKN